MATKDKKPTAKKATSATKVTRITARDTEKVSAKPTATKTKKATPAKTNAQQGSDPAKKKSNPFTGLIGYFKGAWYELRQVSWPNRKATWSMTAALLAFTAFFVVMILLLDTLFKYLFELILA